MGDHTEVVERKNGLKTKLDTDRILDELKGMKERGSIVSGPKVTQDDIYVQMTGLIVKLAMESD